MKELKELENKINEMKSRIRKLEEKNGELEYELMIYNTERKSRLIQNFNESEKNLIEFIEELQNDNLYNDFDIATIELNDFEMLLKEYFNNIKSKINEENIKIYFEYNKHNK